MGGKGRTGEIEEKSNGKNRRWREGGMTERHRGREREKE